MVLKKKEDEGAPYNVIPFMPSASSNSYCTCFWRGAHVQPILGDGMQIIGLGWALQSDINLSTPTRRFVVVNFVIDLPVFKVPLEVFQFLAHVLHLTEKDRSI